MSTQACSICGNQNSKYHCPSCRAPSCSLPCFKSHKSQCPQSASEADTARSATASESAPPSTEVLPLNVNLTQDPRLQQLFEQYPNLRAKLKYIFETAIANDHDEAQSNFNPRVQGHQNSPQKRIARAMRILASQLVSDSAEASGLKAFAELVAELNANKTD